MLEATKMFSKDILIIILFLTATLIIGVRAGRQVDKSTDYALARGLLKPSALLLSLLATLIGAITITGYTEEVYDAGIMFMIVGSAPFFSALILGKFIVPNINERFKRMMSSTDIMRFFYPKANLEIPTAVISYIACLLLVAIQLIAIGYVFKIFLDISFVIGVLVAGIVITFYSTTGGVKSVVITDILQFSVIVIMLPLIITVVLGEAGNFETIYNHIPQTHLSLKGEVIF